MILSRIQKLNIGFSGFQAGKPARSSRARRGSGTSAFKYGRNLLCSCLCCSKSAAWLLAALFFVLIFSSAAICAPVQGDKIVNHASINWNGAANPAPSSVTVTVVIRTLSTIEVLEYAPLLSGTEQVNVSPTAYRSGSAGGSLVNLPSPTPVGSSTPIDLSQPVPLTAAGPMHQGEPIFIRVTDLDQNLDSTVAETIFVTVTNPANGDVEIIRLTETGPNTGVFVGYLPTRSSSVTSYNGSISVKDGDTLSISYVDAADGSDTSATTVMIDPFGIVLDSSTGQPVNGVTITIINNATGLPATVYGDDGISTFPSTVTSGGYYQDSSGKGYQFPQGGYQFPFILPGSYRFQIVAPAGYGYPSTVATATIQALPGAPFAIVSGSRGEVFVLNPGPAMRIDIPVDPAASSIWLQKTANKDTAGQGDFILYQLTVVNNSQSASIAGIQVVDTLPIGFRLRKASVKLNGVSVADPVISADGRTLTFTVGALAASSSVTINYVVEVTAGARLGDAVNNAVASAGKGLKSNKASATVKIKDDFMKTKSILMGRVTTGECNNKTGEGTRGVEDVRVYLEDGSFVISDKQGKFHFEGVRSGLHVVQLDLDSLPEGYEAVSCTDNSRFAGRAFSQFVETQGGTLWRTDFHIRKKPALEKTVTATASPVKGEVVLELANAVKDKDIAYTVSMRGSAVPVRAAKLKVILPEGVLYKQGSSLMDGIAIDDPQQIEKTKLVFDLKDQKAGWRREITFSATLSGGSRAGELVTQAYLAAYGDGTAEVLTPPAETVLQLERKSEKFQMPDIVLRPHFPVRGASLNDEDRKKLDELAGILSGLHIERIKVTGYTDNMPIAPRNRTEFADNQALSLARAGSVGRYLMDKLRLPPEKIVLEGKGSADPIADNRTEAGRKLNRRVEIRIASSRVINSSRLNVVKELSGEKRAETGIDKHASVENNIKYLQQDPVAVAGESFFAVPDADDEVQETKSASKASPSAASDKEPENIESSSESKESERTINDPEGILYPVDSEILVNRTNSIRVCLNSKLVPRMLIDNKEVPSNRIGFTMKDEKAGKTIYSYIGVDFGKTGKHVIEFEGVDPFGNVRFKKKISVKRSGEIVSIRLKSSKGNIADGKTPVKLLLELYDAEGNRIPAATDLEIREGNLTPLKQPDIFAQPPVAGSFPHVQMTREGEVLFQPINNSGSYRVVLGYNSLTVEAETYVQPMMRDWILVGLGEGTAGYNTVSGNMENLRGADIDDKFYKDGRVAFFAKGQIKGKWLLTIAYDSAKTKENSGNGLFQTINPESYYTLYGDSSQQQYDASSTNKLYLKIEREQFYAMFGDYDTGLTITELSRYSRRMTGVKTEMQSKNFELNAFASETEQVYTRDEIPGDGTSGIYRLSRRNIVSGSEKITIEVRDRFRSEVLISSRALSRFTEYSIDYDAGTILFKEPVYSRDEKLNPIIIVAEYETVSEGGKDYTYGGRAGVKLLDNKLKAGGSYVHEGQGDQSSNLYGVDATYKLDQNTKLRGEIATSDYSAGVASRSGNAYLAEMSRTSKQYDAKVYIREQAEGFGLGQQPGGEAGTRKLGAEGAYRVSDNINASANVYRQYNLLTNATRDMAEGKFNYSEKNYGTSVGFLHANDQLGDGSSHESNQLTLGGKIKTLNDRLTLMMDHAQSIINNGNSDYPTRTSLGAEFAVSRNLTLLAAQEFTWGDGANTQNTRLGMRSSPWSGATLNSSVNRQFNENDDRVFADVGIKQNWKVNDEWKVDAGVERSQTVAKSEHYRFNNNVSSASGNVVSSSGVSEDFTAFSGGATYQVKKITWDNRLELRVAETENKWSLVSGLVKEVNNRWAWTGRLQLFRTSSSTGIDTTRADLRHGLVYRPAQTSWIVLNRFDFVIDKQSGNANSNYDSWRLINNLTLNYRPIKELQLSMHYGAKYVQEKIDESEYSGYTDFIGIEGRYDLNKDWDIGLNSSIMHSWNSSQFDYCNGMSVGYNVMKNAWLSVGYNLTGFKDKDFSEADFTGHGPFFRFRFKFDQNSVYDAAKWLNGNDSSGTITSDLSK